MPIERLGDSDISYLSIIAGKLSQKVTQETAGAVKREYEIDGKKWEKWELHYKNLSGFVTWTELRQTDFWEVCSVLIEQDWEKFNLSFGTDSRYFGDFMKKLPNIDLKKPITLNPYDFESKGKQIRWLDIRQDWEKIQNYYYDADKQKNINWFPEINEKELEEDGKDYRSGYFLWVKKFLKKELTKIEFPNINTWSKIEESDVEDVFWDDNIKPF